jgi:hypothetical protein
MGGRFLDRGIVAAPRALSTVAGAQLEAIAERIVDVQAPPSERPSMAAQRRPPRAVIRRAAPRVVAFVGSHRLAEEIGS